jgi:hypothetical protein
VNPPLSVYGDIFWRIYRVREGDSNQMSVRES